MEQYFVTEGFLKEAHEAACESWKKRIEKEFPNAFPKTELDEIKETSEYEEFVKEICGNSSFLAIYNGYKIMLPFSNTEWTLAAFQLAKYISTKYRCTANIHTEGNDRFILLQKR